MKYIGLVGNVGSGRRVLARMIHSAYDVHLTALIAPVERMLMAIHQDPNYDRVVTEKGGAHTNLVKSLEAWGRTEFGPSFWIDAAVRDTEFKPIKSARVIVDVKHRSEANWIKDQGGTLVQVRRYEIDGAADYNDPWSADIPHIEPDVVVLNNEGFLELQKKAETLGEHLGLRTQAAARAAAQAELDRSYAQYAQSTSAPSMATVIQLAGLAPSSAAGAAGGGRNMLGNITASDPWLTQAGSQSNWPPRKP